METETEDDRSEGPPRKRLLADPSPKESFINASPESAVSSDSSSDRFSKKTRQLPNLSDCHSCGVRINYTNPRERLQPLDSMWRIVLLCRRCAKRVKSSELCPYCFASLADEKDCFKCRDCQHSIHQECVSKYGSGLGYPVCVDCWVPDAISNSIRVRKRKIRKKNMESCERVDTLPESRVSVQETNDSTVLDEDVVKKVAAAAKANEIALRKALVAKNAVELAKGVLNVFASTKVAGSCETNGVDDAELAIILHRAINSSPRISRYASLTSSSSGDDVPVTYYSRRHAIKKNSLMNSGRLVVQLPLICYYRRRRNGFIKNSISLDAPLLCYSRRHSSSKACLHVRECESRICNPSERIDKQVSICSAGLKNCGSIAVHLINGNGCKEHDGGKFDMKPEGYLLKYHRIGKGTPRPSVFGKDSDRGSCIDSAHLNAADMLDTFGNGNKSHEMCENIDENANRFLLKYKRSIRSKPEFICEVQEVSPPLPSIFPKDSTMLSDTRFQ